MILNKYTQLEQSNGQIPTHIPELVSTWSSRVTTSGMTQTHINDGPQSRRLAKKPRVPELRFSSTLREAALVAEELDDDEQSNSCDNLASLKAASSEVQDGIHGPGSVIYVVLLLAWTAIKNPNGCWESDSDDNSFCQILP